MRYSWLLLILISAPSSGCSALLAYSGTDLAKLKTKEQVCEQFGEPIASGIDKDGEFFEEFRSRRKFRDPMSCQMYAMSFGMTLGLSEVLAFPAELFLLGRGTLLGHDIRFTYDRTSTVTSARLDGSRVAGIIPNVASTYLKTRMDEREQESREPLPDSNQDRPGPFIRSAASLGQQSTQA